MRGGKKIRGPPTSLHLHLLSALPQRDVHKQVCIQACVRVWVCMFVGGCTWMQAGENKEISDCLRKNTHRPCQAQTNDDKWWINKIDKLKKNAWSERFPSLLSCWFLLITHCCQTELQVRTSHPPPPTPPSTMGPSPPSEAHSSTTYEVTLSTCLHPCWFATHYVTFPLQPPPAEQDETQPLIKKKKKKVSWKKVARALRNSSCLPANTERLWSAGEAWYLSAHLDCDVACPNLLVPQGCGETWSRWRLHLERRVKAFATLCDVSLKRTWTDLEAFYLAQ